MQSPDSPVVVVDTDVLIAGMRGGGAANSVLLRCLRGQFGPVVGAALLAEYEDVVGRESVFKGAQLTRKEREEFLDIFLSACRWVRIYYAWRPNLRDEGDNHLIELAVAASARYVVTRNVRHFRNMQLRFPHIEIIEPTRLLKVTA